MNLFRFRTLLFIFLILAISRYDSNAGDHSNARGDGMANASMLSSFGINAFGLNPANFYYETKTDLGIRQVRLREKPVKPTMEISIFSGGGSYGSDESLSFYNNYLKYLSINRQTFTGIFTDLGSVLNFRQNILPEKTTQVNYNLELKWFSVNYTIPKFGAFNFSIDDDIGLNTDSYSRDQEMPVTFRINSYQGKYDLTNVNINQAEASAWWIRKYAVSFAKQIDFPHSGLIKNIKFGASVGIVNGFGNIITYNTSLYVSTFGIIKNPITQVNHVDSIIGRQDFHTRQSLTDFFQDYRDGAHQHFNFFPKPAGKGYSIDLGFNMQIADEWHIALSVTDLGKIWWNYNTFINDDTNHFAYYNFDLNSSDPTYNTFINDLDGISTRIANKTYTTDMPTRFRAGVMFQPSDRFILESDWMKGNNNLPGNSNQNVLSVGSEYYPLDFLPLRAGLSIGGPGGYYIGIGTGIRLKNLVIDISTSGINQIIANKRLSISFSGKYIL